MIKLHKEGAYLVNGKILLNNGDTNTLLPKTGFTKNEIENATKNTIAYKILQSHNTANENDNLKIKFDAMASHDITYVSIILTAIASKMEKFPLPYVLTNCHNSLCAVGGTINEDDHLFGLSAAKKFGGVFVPPHMAVIHQYMREMYAGCGKMIMGSDSHTRYGALGTLAIGEGGGELAKQLLGKTYDIERPQVVGVHLKGTPRRGVGPQDVALLLVKETFKTGFVKNKVMEFFGEGVHNLSMDYRIGIDVMSTETTCLSSIWQTDEKTREYLCLHNREDDYKELSPGNITFYDSFIEIDLDNIIPMIALPFHPSNVYTIQELNSNTEDIVALVEKNAKDILGPSVDYSLSSHIENGRLRATQAIIAGCSGGTFENIVEADEILKKGNIGTGELALSVYPASLPIFNELVKDGVIASLTTQGAVMKTAFCGPCFGAGDVPSNKGFSIRHTTRNFPNREGSKPSEAQSASVALMDARSIAASAANGGFLTSADTLAYTDEKKVYSFDSSIYTKRVYNGIGNPKGEEALKFGPNIKPWPEMDPMGEDMLVKVISSLKDEVTTTDELIPSGETSSFRSNPLRLAQFTLSRKDPDYVKKANKLKEEADKFYGGEIAPEITQVMDTLYKNNIRPDEILTIAGAIFAKKPGDGSAREQAASCQKVLGGGANFAFEYATKRYRSNLINWGIVPFLTNEQIENGEWVYIPSIKNALLLKKEEVKGYVIANEKIKETLFGLGTLTEEERQILISGCLINYYKDK